MATNPPPQQGGFFQAIVHDSLFGIPIWIWIGAVVVVGGFIIIPKIIAGRSGQNTSAADATSSDAGASNAGISPAQSWFNTTSQAGIDPYTGVPYSIEESINPATGNANYYNPPVTNQTQAPGAPPPTPPVQNNNPTPPLPTGSAITYTGGKTIPFGGTTFQAPGRLEIEHIAEQQYGFEKGSAQLQNAIGALSTANQTSYNGESAPRSGTVIKIPQVNQQTGQLIA